MRLKRKFGLKLKLKLEVSTLKHFFIVIMVVKILSRHSYMLLVLDRLLNDRQFNYNFNIALICHGYLIQNGQQDGIITIHTLTQHIHFMEEMMMMMTT